MGKLLDGLVAHPIWTMIGALAAVAALILTLYPDLVIRGWIDVPPSLEETRFFAEEDKYLQEDRQDIYVELCSVLSRPPNGGTEDAIHATFTTHYNSVSMVTPTEGSRQSHLSEVRALSKELRELLDEHELNEFTADAIFAIGIGIGNMANKYEEQ